LSSRISLIAAMDRNRVIGRDGRIPWRLPADFAFFKRTTLGKPVIMGRKTWESLPVRPLPGRRNIVLSRDADYNAPGGVVVGTVEAALREAGTAPEIMVIGGAQLYRLFWDWADRIYLTHVDASVTGDASFPEIDRDEWRIVARQFHPADEKNAYDFEIVTYERLKDGVAAQ